MTTTNGKSSQRWYARGAAGRWTKKFSGDKKLRSMRLTDEAWDGLDKVAEEAGLTRTDLLEILGRKGGLSAIVLEAVESYLEACKDAHAANPTKKGTDFSTKTRDFTHLIRFQQAVESGQLLDPVELLGDELE